MRIAKLACAASAAFALTLAGAPSQAHDSAKPAAKYKSEIETLRKAMRKYEDWRVAVRDLYLSTTGCVHYSGEKVAGYMEYGKGAMGIHFVNFSIQGPPDPMRPNVLIYEPVGKSLKLVAVEWLVPLTPEMKEKPSIFGIPFMGPMEGHEPLIAREYVHYDLHMWLTPNPYGMFAATNPKVSCKGYAHSLLEKGTKMMAGP
jgi:hypothetical protein